MSETVKETESERKRARRERERKNLDRSRRNQRGRRCSPPVSARIEPPSRSLSAHAVLPACVPRISSGCSDRLPPALNSGLLRARPLQKKRDRKRAEKRETE